MSTLSTLGFVELPAWKVLELANKHIAFIRERRALKRAEWIRRESKAGWFRRVILRKGDYTEEETVKRILSGDYFSSWDFSLYDDDYISPQQEKMNDLVTSASGIATTDKMFIDATIAARLLQHQEN